MSRSWILAAGAMVLVLTGSSAVCAAERTEDPLGDIIGDAPDIVAVTFSQPEDEPRVSVSIEFAEDSPFDTDMETYSDVVFIHLDVDPEVMNTVQFEIEDEYDYIIGTHAVQLPFFVESGGMLYETAGLSEIHENVVDVTVDGSTITWTVDLALIGDPAQISWAVLAGVEMEGAEEAAYDVSPDEGEPWGLYAIDPEAVDATGVSVPDEQMPLPADPVESPAMPAAVEARPDDALATWVTGTSSVGEMRPPESMVEGPVNLVRGIGFTSTVEWSDPRLPAAMTTIANIDEHPLELGNAATWAQAHRLDGPDGAWVGTGRGAIFPDGEDGLVFLAGEGMYEGLGAVLRVVPTDDGDVSYEGYIYDTGLPPVPDPIGPRGE